MQVIIKEVAVKSKTFFGMIFSSYFQLFVGETELSIKAVSETLNIVINTEALNYIKIKKDNIILEKEVEFQKGENLVEFLSESIEIKLVFIYVENAWGYLEREIEMGMRMYKGREYYVNEETYETSYVNSFVSKESQFPAFKKIEYMNRIYYADVINKLVIAKPPEMKQKEVKNKLRVFLKLRRKSNCIRMTKIEVERGAILQTGGILIMKEIRRMNIYMLIFSFKGEIGEDYGAIRREFFYLAFEEMFKDERLIKVDGIYDVAERETPLCFYYNYDAVFDAIEDILADSLPSSYNINNQFKDDRVFFVFLGMLIGFSMHFKETFKANFSLSFYENLLGRNFTLRHIQDVQLQRGVLLSKCMDDNQIEYPIKERLFESRRPAYNYIRLGFMAIIPEPLPGFTAFDFPFIFYHYEPLTCKKLKRQVRYSDCLESTREVKWLWRILDNKDQKYLSQFLQFFTGSGCLDRFEEDSYFWFEQNQACKFMYASSCARKLVFGFYDTINDMEYHLDYSILNSAGFHKV